MKAFKASLNNVKISLQISKILSAISSASKTVWQSLLVWMTSRDELRVWETSDSQGETSWHAYDPVTGRSISVASDAEMRAWIEQRYYQ